MEKFISAWFAAHPNPERLMADLSTIVIRFAAENPALMKETDLPEQFGELQYFILHLKALYEESPQ